MARNRKEYRLCFYLDNPEQQYIVDKIEEEQQKRQRKKRNECSKVCSKEVIMDILYTYFKAAERTEQLEKEGTADWYAKQTYLMLKALTDQEAPAISAVPENQEEIVREEKMKESESEDTAEVLPQGIMDFIGKFN